MDEELERTIINHLHRLIGHAHTVDEMIAEKRDPAEVLNQLLAVESAIHKLTYEHYDKFIRVHIRERANALAAKHKNLAEDLEQMAEQAFQLPLNKLPKLLYRLRQLENQKR